MSLQRLFHHLERNNFTKTCPLILHKILVSFYVTTPTPPSTTPIISNQPFTCQISRAQDHPECSHISAQHSPSIAHASTPDIVFGIPYYHTDVNPGNYYSSSNRSFSRHVNFRHYFPASHHGLHLAKYSLPASNSCSTGIPSIPSIAFSPLALQCTSWQLFHHPTSSLAPLPLLGAKRLSNAVPAGARRN
jgi:hypothetical protein